MIKNLLLWLVIAAVLLTVFQNFSQPANSNEMIYSDFIREVQAGQIRDVTVSGWNLTGHRINNQTFSTVLSPYTYDPKLMDDLLTNNVDVKNSAPEQQSIWMQILLSMLPLLIIIVVFMLFMRQMQGGGVGGKGGPMAFGKSKAKMLSEDQVKVTFADVAGVDEAKEDVKELVDFLREPDKFQRLGGRIPRGVLMVGQPGT
ncbi:MAG: ATP-dependent metallopeptidase FtsH/Yme1/Tma family protein, partial [Pseudomonadales bacterium]|nr:ATP-dependent metallopeptidase FtsH/Yme1/Tma family protein [Pseudomonadales bacterium]